MAIKSTQHAIEVQTRRTASGKLGRPKAIRRWFKKNYGRGIEGHPSDSLSIELLKLKNIANFTGCRDFIESHPEI